MTLSASIRRFRTAWVTWTRPDRCMVCRATAPPYTFVCEQPACQQAVQSVQAMLAPQYPLVSDNA